MFVAVCFGALSSCGPKTGTESDGGGGALCRSDRECSGAGLVCDRSRGRCVQCVGDTDCTSGQVCARNECAAATPCTTSRMCPGQVCDPGRGRCVDCVEDLDCPSTDRCDTSRCVARPVPCASDRECSALNRVCDPGRAFCVECVRDTDCPSETFCSPEALCQPTVCAANGLSCASETRTRACNANGSMVTETECAAGTRCASGRCVEGPAPDVVVPPMDAAVEGGVDVVTPPPDAPMDVVVPPPDASDVIAPAMCTTNEACSNGVYCDGFERCLPGNSMADARGCVAAAALPCTAPAICVEAERRCQEPTVTCTAPMADCDRNASTGCETNVNTSPNNCGGCGVVCAGLVSGCVSGHCDKVVAIDSGLYELCARYEGGSVACWTTGRTDQEVVAGITTATDIAVGVYSTCAVLRDGTVRCWGANDMGQLGNGTTTPSTTPVAVSGLTDAVQVTAGEYFFCARRSSGAISCWGNGARGQLGHGMFASSSTPVAVASITNAVEVRAGRFHVCVRLSDATLRCWGDNGYQQLLDRTTTNRATPVTPVGLPSALEIAAASYTTYVRSTSGVVAWGYNADGQAGDGTLTLATTARTVSGLGANVRSLGAGSDHACAVLDTGEARCWGSNTSRQLGDGTSTRRTTPVPFMAPAGIRQIEGGVGHSCARYESGELRCWSGTESASAPVPL